MFLKISTMMLCLGLIIGMTNKVAYSANYLKKDGLFDTGLVFKGKKLAIKWGAKQPTKSSKRGALFYFHGDGGNGQGALGSLSDIVFKYGYHAVAIKTPFSNSWQGPIDSSNDSNPYPNAQAFNKFLLHYIQKYNVDRNKIYFSGVSGGAMFLGGHFIPMYGRNFKGGMILLCGGATSARYNDGKAVFFNPPEFAKNFKIFHHISKKDYLFEYAEEGRRDYSRNGHLYNADWTESPGHCGFPIFKVLKKGLEWMH